MKLKLHLFRITYLLSFFTLVLFTFIRDNHLIASIFGIIFFFNGFYLFYLEKVIEKKYVHYNKTLSCTIWRLLLLPWFIIL
ncbi:hypothetical protein DY037_00775 [Apilactobacillus micheneri]|nr:hypothetical protein DY037_00775 [Apilactobacillus micheneri]